jgi:hypothetical protein
MVETRVPSILLTTSGTTENRKNNDNMKTHFKTLPSLKARESISGNSQRPAIQNCYSDAGPKKLICHFDSDESAKEENVLTEKSGSVFLSDVNHYESIILQDLVNFKAVPFSRD